VALSDSARDDIATLISSVSSRALFLSWALITVVFAGIYWILAEFPGQGPTLFGAAPLGRFFEALYYSIIIGTTTGLGDIVPQGIAKFFTAVQAISSFILLAAFVAKFAARRQEKVLDDIHQLSFDSSFHTIRNGLFIARKDIDAIIKKLLSETSVEKKDWQNLKTALRQMQIFIKHIPDFYRKTAKTHMFDIDREMLLIDSLERTLTRLVEALDLFRKKSVDFMSEDLVVRELHSLIRQIENLSLHEEQKTIDPENHEAFQEILGRAEDIRAHVKPGKTIDG
jgi:hypothetical protein